MIAPVSNPFVDIMAQLAEISAKLDRLEQQYKDPRPEWEPISVSIKRRKKARKTLLEAVLDGRVKRHVEDSPGGQCYLLNIHDLDRHFPARS